MKKEFRLWLTSLLIKWAFDICPDGKFKVAFAIFVKDNIFDL
jgi:hypothetical protein